MSLVTHPRPRVRVSRLALVILLFAAAPFARATLLVYEGFDGYATGTLGGQNPDANTVGLDTTTAYYDGPMNRTAGFTIQTTGLTFGPLETSGGALAFTTATNVVGANLSLASAYTGTLWSSYLVNLSSNSAGTSSGAVLRIGATPADSANAYFNISADTRFSANTKVSVGYGTNSGTDGTGSLALNTTYIIISSFTNVGVALNDTTTGVATLWALTQSQFQSFISAGADPASLGAYATVTATSPAVTTGTYTFGTGKAFGIITQNDTGTIDELRYGTTLADVTPVTAIPEPAISALLLALGCAAIPLVRRPRWRRRA